MTKPPVTEELAPPGSEGVTEPVGPPVRWSSQERPTTARDNPAASQPMDIGLLLERGTRVERYVILKPVGQGGIGVVYAAYDPELDRKVALKLLRPDKAQSGLMTEAAGLLREAQAMARVSHPNVIAVHDVGTVGGGVFIAMEFIQGQNLHEWVRQQPHLTQQQVLRVFLQAGQGLVAAHQVGLVHRDFKPANVLLGNNDRVCVTDFGLARLSPLPHEEGIALPDEETLVQVGGQQQLATPLTQAGLVKGTPHFMPPEQYLGSGVDSRSDQFSFCASLCWALYRKHAVTPRLMVEAATQAVRRQGEAPPGTEAWRLLPRDSVSLPPADDRVSARVRSVLSRGMSLHPDDRFPSMAALLEALAPEQRRGQRRGALAAVGLVAAAAVGTGLYVHHQSQLCAGADALVGSVWGPTERQKLEAAFSATGKPFATESAHGVTRLLDAYASRWARLHTEACEATRVRGEQTEALLSLRMVCLERRRKSLDALVDLFTGADGKVVERSVDAASALPGLEECRDIESLSEQPALPDDPLRRAAIEQLGEQLARIRALLDAGRYAQGLELARKLEPQAALTAYLPVQAELSYLLAWLLHQQGEPEESLRQFERALQTAEASHADRQRLEMLTRFTYALANNGHTDDARRWGEMARGVLERVGTEPPSAIDLNVNLGYAALFGGRYKEAWESFSKARALEGALALEDPRRAKVSHALGLAALRLGDLPKAIVMLSESLKRTEELKGPKHPEVAIRQSMLATAYRESGEPEKALEHAQAALAVRRAALGAEHPSTADDLDELGECFLQLKRYDEALTSFREAEALKRRVLGAEHPDLSYSLDGVGKTLLAQGLPSEAIGPLRQALSFENTDAEALAETGFTLAQALWATGREWEPAREEARRARERYTALGKQRQVAEISAWLDARKERAAPHGSGPR
ncbi:tetratricopeptide repeat protein [Pyxidicoccus parkwayensis]|uniref:non-specific serine/threonine protein kinase n=1 Tax=Pyxidicoccus parkwayensis TaxID=2813578 RepID=A0ABX7P7E2_9BACT|nr:serine/threonine-protein kinase [Pyxidicoccus parkwaysis]QSQ26404.1 tetratricopeptide repeat protein [Pyxidicoccus parkwaysis]